MAGLTPKQEAFALAYIQTGNASEAYRLAYDTSKMTEKSVNENASKLLKHAKVAPRIAELRAPAVEKAGLTLEKHLDDLLRLRNMAVKDAKWTAAIQAEIARGKAAGLYVERTELTGKDGAPIPLTNVPVDEYLKARSKVLGEF
ncbi:MAG: Burkholderia phage vB BmuP [Pseudomonadota bacterium]|jgi:phage terminase small subunit